MELYHGSGMRIEHPVYGAGNPKNDYGLGFYCTRHFDLAAEWACTEEANGFVNSYILNEKGLTIFHLTDGEYHILHWMAVLLENRTFQINTPIKRQGREYLLGTFLPAYRDADIMIGYRADDSCFSFANDFLGNEISVEQLSLAMRLGDLGHQIVLRSKKAFRQLEFAESVPVSKFEYYPKRMARDAKAREAFRRMRGESVEKGTFLVDLMRMKGSEADETLRRILSE